MVKNLPASAGDEGDVGLIPGSGRCPGGGNANRPVFLPGESYGQRSLAGYRPWGHRVGHNKTTEHNTQTAVFISGMEL